MSIISLLLEPDADGNLRIPLPSDLRLGKVRIVATVEAATEESGTSARERAVTALERIAARGGVTEIPDPIHWQRERRRDRSLPGYDA